MSAPNNAPVNKVELTEEAKQAIKRYLIQLAIAGATVFGILNVLSLFTVVPRLAAEQVTHSATLQDLRDDLLRKQGALQEKLDRTGGELERADKSIKELNDRIEAFKKTDTATLVQRANALNSLSDDSKKILDAVTALRAEIPTRVIVRQENEAFWQSEPFSNQGTADCPAGSVQIGNHYGINNRDMRIRCRQITIGR